MYQLSLLVAVSVMIWFCFLLWRAFLGSLAAVPGPIIARFSNFWMVKQTLDGSQHLVWHRLHESYGLFFIDALVIKGPDLISTGPIVRIGPRTVLIADPEAFRTVYGPRTTFPKGQEYEAFNLLPNVPNIFSVRSLREHSYMRKRIAKAVRLASNDKP
jgi:hypothetical protein